MATVEGEVNSSWTTSDWDSWFKEKAGEKRGTGNALLDIAQQPTSAPIPTDEINNWGSGGPPLRVGSGPRYANGQVIGEGHAIDLTRMNIAKACFAAGTLLYTPQGYRAIESFRVGDLVFSRAEEDPTSEISAKRVEEVFVHTGRIWILKVNGREIRTTGEHPFWVRDRGWVNACELAEGNRLLSQDGQWVVVEAIKDTNRYETVYNLRIADYHTYFVGGDDWGFNVWAHNACVSLYKAPQRGMGARQFASGYGAADFIVGGK